MGQQEGLQMVLNALGPFLVTMLEARVSADGGATKELGSVMTLAVLSDGELTLVRSSKQNVGVTDVDSLEKAEKRVAIKNLEENEEVEKRMKPSNLLITHDNEIDSEEDEIDPDTSTISRLYGDLTEEVMDDNSVGLDGVLVDVPIKVAKSKKKKKLLNKNVAAKKNCFNERSASTENPNQLAECGMASPILAERTAQQPVVEEPVEEIPPEPQQTSGQTSVPEPPVEKTVEQSTSAPSTNPAEASTLAPREPDQAKE
ncbi:uncharacterized protein [Miscanthus floridulus]|uniref:uncharacterized protein n=1 Tax=Miscanthus floridulus TaxID=154761 RepID=UPI0034575865